MYKLDLEEAGGITDQIANMYWIIGEKKKRILEKHLLLLH